MILHSAYRLHLCFHGLVILHHLGIFLPHEDDFGKVENTSLKCAYYSKCDDCGVNADEIWMNDDWFYTTPDTTY